MKKIFFFFLILLCVLLVFVVFFHERTVGYFLEPVLESKLVEIFNIPVRIKNLRGNIFTGLVQADIVEFDNPPEFITETHFLAEGFEGRLNLRDLARNRYVNITYGDFKKLTFIIERKRVGKKETLTNIRSWIDDLQDWRRRRKAKQLLEMKPPKKPWRTRIGEVRFHDLHFTYLDRSNGQDWIWNFSKLQGFWKGFDYPSKAPEALTETLFLRGLFGKETPTDFFIEGTSNFAGKVNFDFRAGIEEGSMTEYDFLWKDIKGEVEAGTFSLQSTAQCVQGDFNSFHLLTLKNVHIESSTTQKILDFPFRSLLGFLTEEEQIELQVEVHGEIQDPKFEFFKAFNDAFRRTLVNKIKSGFGLTGGAKKVAQDTGNGIRNGLSKIGETVSETFERVSI